MGATCTLHLTQWMFEQICAHCVETILIDSVMCSVHVYRDGYTWMDGCGGKDGNQETMGLAAEQCLVVGTKSCF